MDEHVFSVSEINGHIRSVLDSDPALRRILVEGELSNYKVYPSGHHYFTLKDAESSLRCVMFRSDAAALRFRPENGLGVICRGRISVYPRDGAYQLYASSLQPAGVGELYLAFEQLKTRLAAEGLFSAEHKKPLPEFPERIAVITSGAGAAVRDVIRILGKRWPLARVIVLPVRVQGAEAPAEIAGAIRYANRWRVADLIITGRGGGSVEDLWAFNDERVARAVYESELPVISAVGHEPDVTISDFVADVRAATPSNAAELAVPVAEEIADSLTAARLRLNQAMRKKTDSLSAGLRMLAERPVLADPTVGIHMKRESLERIDERLRAAFRQAFSRKKQEYIALTSTLEAMSPLGVLTRGYSVATDSCGRVLTDASCIFPGDSIHVKMAKGGVFCRVDKRSEDDDYA